MPDRWGILSAHRGRFGMKNPVYEQIQARKVVQEQKGSVSKAQTVGSTVQRRSASPRPEGQDSLRASSRTHSAVRTCKGSLLTNAQGILLMVRFRHPRFGFAENVATNLHRSNVAVRQRFNCRPFYGPPQNAARAYRPAHSHRTRSPLESSPLEVSSIRVWGPSSQACFCP